MKLGAAIAISQEKATTWKNNIKDFINSFDRRQGQYQGFKKTFQAADGMADEPTKRGYVMVQTTVKEKFDWLIEKNLDFFNTQFSVEATNASGAAKAELIIEGVSYGELSTLELMRLKSLVSDAQLKLMYNKIPVRSDSKNWKLTDSDDYAGRDIFETPFISGEHPTTIKDSKILVDPNLQGKTNLEGYAAQVVTTTTKVKAGDYTSQEFSGEWSQRKKAELLVRLENVRVACIKALSVANDIEVVESDLDSKSLLEYIHFNG